MRGSRSSFVVVAATALVALTARTARADETPTETAAPAAEAAPAPAPAEPTPAEPTAAPAPEAATLDHAPTGAYPSLEGETPAAPAKAPEAVAAPKPAAAAASPAPGNRDVVTKPASESIYRRDGLLGPVRLGPTFGVGAPDGMRIGGNIRFKGIISAGAGVTMVPETTISAINANVSRDGAEAWLRVHPFRGAFFLGAAGGWQVTRGQATATVGTPIGAQSGEGRGDVRATYIAPHLGFQWMIPPGITIGFDAGVEIPVASREANVDVSHNGQPVSVDTQDVRSALNTIGTAPIPVIHLLEVGFQL